MDKSYICKGTKKFTEVTFAFFLAGFSTFSILYCVQPILFLFSKEFSLSPIQSSLSLSSSTAMMAIGMLFTGPLSDLIGRKIVMASSLFLAAIFSFFCSTVVSWDSIIVMRALTGLALSGVAAVAMSYLGEEMHPNILSLSIGLYISGNTIGGFLGRFLSSVLSEKFSWQFALGFISILSIVSAAVFTYLLPRSNNFNSIAIHPKKILFYFVLQWKNPILSKLFMMGCILMGSFVTLFNYIGYRLILSPFLLSSINIGFISTIYLIGVYSSPKAGTLIKRYGKGIVLLVSLFMMILGVLITQVNILTIIFLGLILFSAGFFAAHSVTSTWVSQQSEKNKGYTSSIYLFSYYLGSSIFGTISGEFWILGKWLGVSIFVISVLLLGLVLAVKLLGFKKK